jgi:hypothetical protein
MNNLAHTTMIEKTNPIPEFKEHLLTRRLGRLPKDTLIKFWEVDIDFSETKTREAIIKKIVFEYSIKKNNSEFLSKFKDFLRDSVLTAREADYLIHLSKPKNIITWINSWSEKKFIGQKYNFYLHTVVELNQKYLETEEDNQEGKKDKISFPKIAILLVGSKQEKTEELDEMQVISFHSTTEFEIIIRENLDIIEIRGPYQVVKDFVATAILDNDNPLSAAESYFIGDVEDVKKSLVKPISQIIKIDSLKKLIDGSYTKLAGKFAGKKTSKFEATLEELKSLEEETNPVAHSVLKEMLKNPIKGSISFNYKQKKYAFAITKTGGLFFREYIPEEVVTYILYKIKLSSSIQNEEQKS